MKTVTELLLEIAPDLDEIQRGLVLDNLSHAATSLTYVAWHCGRADRTTGGAHADAMRELLEKVDDLRRAYVKLGGYVHPDARGAYPEDVR